MGQAALDLIDSTKFVENSSDDLIMFLTQRMTCNVSDTILCSFTIAFAERNGPEHEIRL